MPSADRLRLGMVSRVLPLFTDGGVPSPPPREFILWGNDHHRDFCPFSPAVVVVVPEEFDIALARDALVRELMSGVDGNKASVTESTSSWATVMDIGVSLPLSPPSSPPPPLPPARDISNFVSWVLPSSTSQLSSVVAVWCCAALRLREFERFAAEFLSVKLFDDDVADAAVSLDTSRHTIWCSRWFSCPSPSSSCYVSSTTTTLQHALTQCHMTRHMIRHMPVTTTTDNSIFC